MKKMLIYLMTVGLAASLPYLAVVSAFAVDGDGEEEPITPAKALVEDIYSFTLTLKVPQVLENTTSQGYRKYKKQKILGDMHIVWLDNGDFQLDFSNLRNKNFKIRDVNVTYDGKEDRDVLYSRYNWIGSNAKNTFKHPCLVFFLELEPSYAIGEPGEDNSFYLALAGSGLTRIRSGAAWVARKLEGKAAGTQGCGCMGYGHKSPTRVAGKDGPTEEVDDVVATYGSWKAVWKARKKP